MSLAEQIAAASDLDDRFAFLEDPARSLPLDQGQSLHAGPLSGLLVGAKSNISVAGQAWTAGIAGRASQIAPEDAEIVSVLREAGAAILSRLTMDEAALGAATEASGLRPTRNPAAPDRSVGGSSGGAAAAVACGAVPVALGSDTLGSVRIPAAYCGVLGLKPTSGLLPMRGVFPLADGFDTPGLLSRETGMMRRLLDLFGDDTGAEEAQVMCASAETDVPCADEIAAAMGHAQAVFERSGHWSGHRKVSGWAAAAVRTAAYSLVCARAVQSLAHEPVTGRAVEQALRYGERLSAEDKVAAQDVCERAADGLLDALSGKTVLMTPTTPEPAFPRGSKPPPTQADFTAIANLAGVPAVAVPIASGGLPLSVQLFGAPGSERTLLDLADILMCAGPVTRTQA